MKGKYTGCGSTVPTGTVAICPVPIPATAQNSAVTTHDAHTSTVTTTTRPNFTWRFLDPQADSQAGWHLYLFSEVYSAGQQMADPTSHADAALAALSGDSPTTRGVRSPFDLGNGKYRAYLRAQDSAGIWSPWIERMWTQNVALPATPTDMAASPSPTPGRWEVELSAATPGSAPYVRFEFSRDGITWSPVRGAEFIPRAATTTGVDRDVPLGVDVQYRAVSFGIDPRVASNPSGTATARVESYPVGGALLTSTTSPALGGEVLVVAAPSWSREQVGGVFETVGNPFPTVVLDGGLKSQRRTLGLDCDRREEWEKVEGVINSFGTLVYRDHFGEVIYCRILGTVNREQQHLRPYADENTPLRHSHNVQIPLVQVAPPKPVAP